MHLSVGIQTDSLLQHTGPSHRKICAGSPTGSLPHHTTNILLLIGVFPGLRAAV